MIARVLPSTLVRIALAFSLLSCAAFADTDDAPVASARHRVIVSTDIGGTDFDDFQSLVHLLVYADTLDIEGLISSPYGAGRKEDILKVIDHYERDFPNLKTYSNRYPTPDQLRSIAKQGETEVAPYAGVRRATEGSEWIVQRARHNDPRPLYVLVWGGIEDLAQALHDAPDILPKLRVYFIGGPNKKWSVDAYHYIATRHPELWIIEANETYRGWFNGGNQDGNLANDAFVAKYVVGQGELGEFFASGITFDSQVRSTIRMGDSPSVAWLLRGNPQDPTSPSWGGQFVPAWERPYKVFDRLTTTEDTIQQFGVFELSLPFGHDAPAQLDASMQIENQTLPGTLDASGAMRFRFSPKQAKAYPYTIHSNVPEIDGKTGALTSIQPPPEAALRPSPRLPNWWTDDPAPEAAVGNLIGAATVSRWREDFLMDFAARLRRCKSPAAPTNQPAGTPPVKLTEVLWHGTGCYKIEMPMGTVYFEKDNGVSGFKSFIDKDGNDWIASYLPPGPNGDFRGFPNSAGNFGHAGRDSGSTTIVNGTTEGELVILESSNADFAFQYWFFPDRVAIKVLRSKGEYCFLLECVAGGTADAEDYFVTADGQMRTPQGEFEDFTPEWLYLGDPNNKNYLFLAKTPDDNAPNENHRQIRSNGQHNMDLYSFGRAGAERQYKVSGMTGNDHVCIIGFMPTSQSHEQIAAKIEGFLRAPFSTDASGSALVSRARSGVSPNRFSLLDFGETPKPARETRALPEDVQ